MIFAICHEPNCTQILNLVNNSKNRVTSANMDSSMISNIQIYSSQKEKPHRNAPLHKLHVENKHIPVSKDTEESKDGPKHLNKPKTGLQLLSLCYWMAVYKIHKYFVCFFTMQQFFFILLCI